MIGKLLKIVCVVFSPFIVNGQQLTVQIEGDVHFNERLLTINEAGNNYPSALEAQSSVQVSVLYENQLNKKKNPNEPWRVFVHKQNMEWNENLSLEVRRTGRGSRLGNPGNPNIQDGDNFQQITNNPTYFFRGRGEIVQIPLALKLSGFSLTMGARDFETSLVFTVYDDW
jgi:hypothetical protein